MDDVAKQYLCDSCGGELTFFISEQKFKCPHCETESAETFENKPIIEHDFNRINDRSTSWNNQMKSISCSSCGSEVIIHANSTSVSCEYCGSSQIMQSKQNAGIPPDAIIPFQVDKHQAGQIFQKWIKNRFWAPSSLKNLFQQDKMKETYLPYWTFDANTDCPYTAQGGKYYYVTVGSGDNKRSERRVRWYSVNGHLQHFFDDVLVNAQRVKESFLQKIDNFVTMSSKPFSEAYLSGFSAEKYTIEPKEAFIQAQNIMSNALTEMAKNEVCRHYDTVRNINLRPFYSNITYKNLLVPVWFSSFFYNDKLYKIAINGQTGTVAGQYPISKAKVTLAIILGVAIIVAICIYSYLQK